MITTDTETICWILWGADAASIGPDDAVFCAEGIWIYPDSNGPIRGTRPYSGVRVRGWPVRLMDGSEPVTLVPRPDGNGYDVYAESWVQDRIGATITGRDGRKLRAHFNREER